jgi:hypothetical protein
MVVTELILRIVRLKVPQRPSQTAKSITAALRMTAQIIEVKVNYRENKRFRVN